MSRPIHLPIPRRRGFLAGMGAAFFGTRGLMAEELEKRVGRIATPEMTLLDGIGKGGARGGFGGPPGRGVVRPGGGAGGSPTPPRGETPPDR